MQTTTMRKTRTGMSGTQRYAWGRWRDRSGGVNMEYVILAVLIAAAVVIAVVMFSRTVASMFFVAADGVTTQHGQAKKDLDKYRTDRDKDAKVAREYHDVMHE